MLKLSRMGVVISPPMPAFYTRPQSILDLVDHTVARWLDLFGIETDRRPLDRRNGHRSPDPKPTRPLASICERPHQSIHPSRIRDDRNPLPARNHAQRRPANDPPHRIARRPAALPLPGLLLARPLSSTDLYKMRSVGSVSLSPDGTRIAYSVENNGTDRPPLPPALPRDPPLGRSHAGGRRGRSSRRSVVVPDGKLFAFTGSVGGKSGLHVANADGTGIRFLAEVTRHQLAAHLRGLHRSPGRPTAARSLSSPRCPGPRPPTRPAIRS